MKLYIKYKDGDIKIAEVNWFAKEGKVILYYDNNDKEYDEKVDGISLVKLDGEVLYKQKKERIYLLNLWVRK